MGLGLEVGLLADLIENDPEGADWVRGELDAAARAMAENGLPAHVEPERVSVWAGDGFPYSWLHGLREVAGRLAAREPLPRDELLDGQAAPFSEALFEVQVEAVFSGRPMPEERDLPPFLHLNVHSDSAGFYVPQDFAVPLMPYEMDDEYAHLWPLGSVPRLQAELAQIAQALSIPQSLTPDNGTLAAVLEAPNTADGAPLWQAQPVATLVLLELMAGCKHALKTGAALAFV